MCRSTDPRDKRTRVGALVETDGGTTILIDTPPELRLQLIAAGVSRVDAILFTHDHADHVHGIDDVRALSDRGDTPIDMYGPPDSMERLAKRFAYIFDESIRPLPGTSKPEGRAHAVAAGKSVSVGDASVTPVAVPHGPVSVYGYRIGKLGYITDAKELPEDAMRAFRGVDV
ncbi:MAG: MBL fold metallo-hydrolase, partial [Gemmatimonadaceae bacterium]